MSATKDQQADLFLAVTCENTPIAMIPRSNAPTGDRPGETGEKDQGPHPVLAANSPVPPVGIYVNIYTRPGGETGEGLQPSPRSPPLGGGDRGLTGDAGRSASPGSAAKRDLDLLACVQEIDRLSGEIAKMDKRLEGPNQWQRDTESAIRDTHEPHRLNHSATAIERRRPHFERLLVLAATWGPLRKERRELVTQRKALERLADMIRRDNARKAAKLDKAKKGQR